MQRQQWKDIAEAVGFLAIIASLVFVGIETRNSTRQSELNTQALEIAAYQALMANIDDLNMLSLESPSAYSALSNLWDENLSDPEQFQQNRLLFVLFRHGDLAYFMYERGAIDDERLRSALAPLPICLQAGREFWERANDAFTENYRKHIDQKMAEDCR